jgi:hypothetical protein
MSYNRELIFAFKQRDDEKLIHAWERFRGLTYEVEHSLRDWMIIHSFYSGLTMSSKSYLNKQSGKTFLELNTDDAHKLLDGLLLEHKIKSSLEKSGMPEEPFDDCYELCKLIMEEKRGRGS